VEEGLTIHNYFPDGRPVDDTFIDTDNTFPAGSLWRTWNGTETLSLDETAPDFLRVKLVCPGLAWEEGIAIAHGGNDVPADRVCQIGFWIAGDANVNVRAFLSPDGAVHFQETKVINLTTSSKGNGSRHVLRCALKEAAPVGLGFLLYEQDNPTLEAAPAATLWITDVMVTEGDAWLFRDGDSAGWSWSGDPHASASSGSQP
jgi:hypothetical protein